MKIHLLVAKEMMPIPSDVVILEDWGFLSITTGDSRSVSGNHMAVKGDVEAIKAWLKPFDGVWLGEGPPAAQEFNVVHVK